MQLLVLGLRDDYFIYAVALAAQLFMGFFRYALAAFKILVIVHFMPLQFWSCSASVFWGEFFLVLPIFIQYSGSQDRSWPNRSYLLHVAA